MVTTPGRRRRVGKEEEEEAPVSAEENMALARRFLEAQVKGDLDAMDEMMAPDFVSHIKLLSVQEPDREGEKWVFAQFSAAVSNASIRIEDQVAAADKVVSRFVVHATHDRGELLGVAPSGRELAFMPVAIQRISEGKIAEEWGGGMGLSELLRRQRLEQEISERERIEQELKVARRIQQASLPKEVPQLKGWQINPYYQPAREVGGDFYDFFELEGGHWASPWGTQRARASPLRL
jgi:ketosteroid isomerase-like protein